MPGVRFAQRGVDLGVWVVEWERQRVVWVVLLVLLDEGRPAEVVGVFENAVDDAALE